MILQRYNKMNDLADEKGFIGHVKQTDNQLQHRSCFCSMNFFGSFGRFCFFIKFIKIFSVEQ